MVGTIHVISKVFSAQEIFDNVIDEKFSLKEIEYSILDWIESYQPTPENYLEIIIFLKELRQKLYQITESLFIKARELMPQSNLTGKYEWWGTCRPLYIECTRCGIYFFATALTKQTKYSYDILIINFVHTKITIEVSD
jgi:hypothetical protein